MRRNGAGWGDGIGRRWERLRPIWPRSRIPPGAKGEGGSVLPLAPLQLAARRRYQHLSKPVRQVPGPLAPCGVFGGLPDQGIVLR
jgi:hypothetical protein